VNSMGGRNLQKGGFDCLNKGEKGKKERKKDSKGEKGLSKAHFISERKQGRRLKQEEKKSPRGGNTVYLKGS